MDIFSAANKQVESANTVVKNDSPAMSRPVENSHRVAKNTSESNEQNKQRTTQELNETVDKLNENMQALETNIKFGFNDKISVMFVNVMEKNTGELIRKIPTEEAMSLAERMQEVIGTIFDEKG